ncbi:integration host factor, actinobacterial type [Candidatus Corynebacterium faecigallinarum]|uniref:integration host factor, actinobacterial type n=1 Tax=Candidatus Corynebacterium faecigallinarum TaxID=2838528 RepID=UPI003FD4EF30
MASSLPTLTPEQRATALQKAAETRAKRSEFTARLRTGETGGAAGLDEALGDPVLVKTRLTSFLRALPGWGKVSVESFRETNAIAENRRLGGLGNIQLAAVRDAVAG